MSKIIFFPANIYTKRKRDCNLAVPPIEALVLPFVKNSNTVAHAACILYNKVHATRVHVYTYHRHLSVAMFCNVLKFTRFRLTKTKRVRRYSLCPYPTTLIGHFPDVDYTKNVRTHVVQLRNTLQNYYKNLIYANIFLKKCFFCYFFYVKSCETGPFVSGHFGGMGELKRRKIKAFATNFLEILHFFAEKFGHIKKKQYLCSPFCV